MLAVTLTSQVYVYLISCLVTLIAILSAIWAFIIQRRRAMELDVLEQRIPDAARYEDLQQRLREAEQDWAAMKDELAVAKTVIAQKEEAEQRLREAQVQLRTLDAERQLQEKLRAELEELQRRHSEEFERDAALRKEREGLEFRVEKLKEEHEQLEPRVEDLRRQQQDLSTAVSSLNGERAKLKQLVASWRKQAEEAQQEAEKRRKERDDLDHQINGLRDKLGPLGDRIHELSDLKTKRERELGMQKERLADLWQPVLERNRFKGNMPEDELECLALAQTYLKSVGLQFPGRVVRAFHTSLKVANVSPLVVLAGISGTGKSELPRRYAEGMGMHFLNIAVQPRWDSPQDMFGFFNYMEGRYRATELARALVQMDPFYKEDGRGWMYPNGWDKNNLCHQMLLVLLDEMNLARIEYYFSEFLSRLEIRRGVNIDDPLDRRKAEIPLEVGGAGGADSILYLFTQTNVVFAGTMNEDETTQTLSDKVVDRANVLRFGKPTRLTREALTKPQAPSKKCLPYGNWEEWLRDKASLDPDTGDAVDKWIERLNSEVMTPIRRPFAYRTHLAIRSYVANYPEQSDYGVRCAMADQIEQKILPKFRGLDTTVPEAEQALNRLTDLLNELKDRLLVNTINELRGSGEHLFTWQGVDRFQDDDHPGA